MTVAPTAPAVRPPPDGRCDARFAAEVTAAAGRILLDLRHEQEGEYAPDSTQLAHLGRTWSALLVRNRIRVGCPGDAMLIGQSADPARLGGRRVWIAEPLDGAAQFSTLGNPDWSVQLALWERGRGVCVARSRSRCCARWPARPPGGLRPRVCRGSGAGHGC